MSFVPALHSGSLACTLYFATRIKVFSGRGLGRRLFQKGGLPSVPLVSLPGKSFGEAGNGSLRGEINTDTY